jgi:hypothetical protein
MTSCPSLPRKWVAVISLFAVALATASLTPTQPAEAQDGSEYPPGFTVFVGPDFTTTEGVAGFFFPTGSTVTMEIDYGNDGSVDYSEQSDLDPDGVVRFFANGTFTVGEGDLVRLSDDSPAANVAETIVQYLTLSVLDVDGDIVAGTARAGTVIEVFFGLDEDHFHVATVTADSAEVWSADAGALGFDLYPGLHGFVQTTHGDGGTTIVWQAPVDVDHLADLEILIEGLELHPATSRSLLTKVASAQKSVERGNSAAACGQLGGFLAQVAAYETAGMLTTEQAAELTSAATSAHNEPGC